MRNLVCVYVDKDKRNDLFRAVTAGGLHTIDCQLHSRPEGAEIAHRPSGSWFSFERAQPGHFYRAVVGDSNESGEQIGPWLDVLRHVTVWAEDVRRNARTPDLWAELQRGQDILGVILYETPENTLFTPDEQAEIAAQLREIKEYVKRTYSLSSEQLSHVETRLDEAEAASRRVGRKDWLLLFSGVILTLIITDLVSPDVVQHIFEATAHGLEHLFGSGSPPRILS